MDGEEVGLGDDPIERQQLDTHPPGFVGRHERVVGDQPHAKRRRAIGDELADPTEPDDAERLAVELDAFPLGALPSTGLERGVSLGHVASLRQQERHRVLGGRDDVRLGGVDDHHAALGRSVDIDVVEADPGPPDDDQFVGRGEDLGGDLRRRTDDQRMSTLDGVEQPFGRQRELHVDDVSHGSQAVKATIGDLFGDQDPGHLHQCCRSIAGGPMVAS